jgi:hypothetical protein
MQAMTTSGRLPRTAQRAVPTVLLFTISLPFLYRFSFLTTDDADPESKAVTTDGHHSFRRGTISFRTTSKDGAARRPYLCFLYHSFTFSLPVS